MSLYEQIKTRLNEAYGWMQRLEVSGQNVRRLAMAEQALEEAFSALKGLEQGEKPDNDSEVKDDG